MKKALLIGINYRGTGSALRGCINDVHNVKQMLLNKGFEEGNIVMLTDDTETKPTKNNISAELAKICASDANTIYIHYSGHGTQVRDTNHDEPDGKDEAICPLDYMHSGMIADDVIREHLCTVKPGVNVFCVFDACHSGTVCDLGYNIVGRKGKLIFARDNKYPDTPCNVVTLSGCLDSQVSSDAFIGGQGQGALTHAFLFAINHAQVQNWGQLYRTVHRIIKKGRFRQHPHLSSGRHISTANNLFL